MRVGILTGGGDVPGLNSIIKSVVYCSTSTVTRSSAFAAGGGLTRDGECVLRLDPLNTRTIDRIGGTMLITSDGVADRIEFPPR